MIWLAVAILCAGGTLEEAGILQSTIMKPMLPPLPIKRSAMHDTEDRKGFFKLEKNKIYPTGVFRKVDFYINIDTIYHQKTKI